ncbi:MAG TPA: hypothetical protein VFJ85_17490 [Acidimicrobiales bacterium]|nr:hypothetical protein [Acidimicrobiales bacterium]
MGKTEHADDPFRSRNAGRKAPEGQGVSAPLASESGGPPQTSIFDGAGNESVVTLAQGPDGRVAEGAGPTLEDALRDAETGDTLLGEDFSPDHEVD